MTDRQAPGRGGAAAIASRERRSGAFLIVFTVVAVAIAVVDALSITHDRAEAGDPVAFWEPLVWETSSVAVLTAIVPLVMAFTRRVRPLEAPWPQVIGLHFLAAVALSVLHVTAMGALRWAIYAAVGSHYAPLSPLGDFLYEFRKDVLVYCAIVAIYVAWLSLVKPPVAAGEGGSGAIEVRDGPRRHFVPLSEVAFIEAAGNYVELHRGLTPILHRAPLSEMERQLRGRGFVRIHRSRLVQRAQITQVDSKPSGDYVVRLADGRALVGSRRYRRPLLEP